MSQQPSLSETIDAIFTACMTRYGSSYFLSRWDGLKLSVVKADWARVLEGLEKNPVAVRYGLNNLPDKPPMAHEFKRICNAAPAPRHACLTHEVQANPQRIADAVEQVAQARAMPVQPSDSRALARSLREREAAGERLSIGQRDFWRRALGSQLPLSKRPQVAEDASA